MRVYKVLELELYKQLYEIYRKQQQQTGAGESVVKEAEEHTEEEKVKENTPATNQIHSHSTLQTEQTAHRVQHTAVNWTMKQQHQQTGAGERVVEEAKEHAEEEKVKEHTPTTNQIHSHTVSRTEQTAPRAEHTAVNWTSFEQIIEEIKNKKRKMT